MTGSGEWSIRRGLRPDASAMARIEREAGWGRWSEVAFEADVGDDERSRVWVAEDGEGQVIGFVVAWRVLDEVQIMNVGTDPAWQRRGVARALIERLLVAERGAGAVRVDLEVRRSNAAAIELYRALGFVPVGERRGYYKDPVEDAVLLRLEVEPPTDPRP